MTVSLAGQHRCGIVAAVSVATLLLVLLCYGRSMSSTVIMLATKSSHTSRLDHQRLRVLLRGQADANAPATPPVYPVVFVVPTFKATPECIQGVQNRTNTIVQEMLMLMRREIEDKASDSSSSSKVILGHQSPTTSDDIHAFQSILAARERLVHKRSRFARQAYDAWYHAPLCHARVARLLRKWFLRELDGSLKSGGAAAAESNVTNTNAAAAIIIPAGPALRAWTFEDFVLANSLAGRGGHFVVVGYGKNLAQRLVRYRTAFRKRCKKTAGKIRLVCSAVDLDVTDARRFHYVECNS